MGPDAIGHRLSGLDNIVKIWTEKRSDVSLDASALRVGTHSKSCKLLRDYEFVPTINISEGGDIT